MHVVAIFEKVHPNLFSVLFDEHDELLMELGGDHPSTGKDELVNAFEKWKDVFWLRQFFMTYRLDLMAYDSAMTVKRAIRETTDEADAFYDDLVSMAKNSAEQLSKLFKPLDNREVDGLPYEFQRLKGKRRWLRLYALKYGDSYVITGGAIKLTRGMRERPHLKLELIKLERVKLFLDSADSRGLFVYLDVI
ncbi:hypothetical protein [Chryseolinea lacunae]|uniref:Uncharacterized protein n=1 Tax=Chryseolinea lacunae TaxID=2801331 RepID=A0ABS1KNG6_9BACT|nr:hypothetical protein [Chryseolinea lacunae]MBL0740787.1 hypothetical protein [Chryseolinea lacunae]